MSCVASRVHDGLGEDLVAPQFELMTVDVDTFGDHVLSVDCQSGVMAILSSSGLLAVVDMSDNAELMRTSVKNPHKVFVHPSGAYVVATAKDGEVYLYSSFERQLLTNFTAKVRVSSSSTDRSSLNPGSSPAAQKALRAGIPTVLVVECISFVECANTPADNQSEWWERMMLVVGASPSALLLKVTFKGSGRAAKGECEILASLGPGVSAVADSMMVRSVIVEKVIGTFVLVASTANSLYRVFDDTATSVSAFFERVAMGAVGWSVREPQAVWDGLDRSGCGATMVFRSSAGGPAHAYVWASAGGIFHGVFPSPTTCGNGAKIPLDTEEARLVEESSTPWSQEQRLSLHLINRGSDGAADSDSSNDAFPRSSPVQVVLTAFHMILLYPQRCIVLNHPAGLPWRGAASTVRGEAPLLEEVLARVRFDPFRGVADSNSSGGGYALRGAVRDVAERRVYVFSDTQLWALHIDHEHRCQWRLFMDRAVDPHAAVALRRRWYDAAYNLSRHNAVLRDRTGLLRGLFYLSVGAARCAAALLARCSNFEEVYTAVAKYYAGAPMPVGAATVGAQEMTRLLLQERYELLIDSRTRSEHSNTQLACLIVMIVVNQLTAISTASCDGTTGSVAKAEVDLESFLTKATARCAALFAMPRFYSLVVRLLEEHGQHRCARSVAQAVGHMDSVIAQCISTQAYGEAVEHLNRCALSARPAAATMYYTFTPLLVEHCPIALFTGIAKVFYRDAHAGRAASLDLDRLMPSLVRYTTSMNEDPANTAHQVLRLLELATLRCECTSAAVHNYYLSLLAKQRDTIRMEEFLRESLFYDVDYALRVCLASGCAAACVVLYKQLRLYEEAVRTVLEYGGGGSRAGDGSRGLDITDAMDILREVGPELGPRTLHHLWVQVAAQAIQAGGANAAVETVQKSGGVLQLEDVLGFVGDDAAVWSLKDAACASLDARTAVIKDLHRRQDEAASTAQRVKADMRRLRHRFGYVSARQRCLLCRRGLLQDAQPYLVYPNCGHVVHEECALRRLRDMGGLEAFITDEGIPPHVLEGVHQIESLAQRDCIVCGEAAVVELDIPLCEDDPSWDVRDSVKGGAGGDLNVVRGVVDP